MEFSVVVFDTGGNRWLLLFLEKTRRVLSWKTLVNLLVYLEFLPIKRIFRLSIHPYSQISSHFLLPHLLSFIPFFISFLVSSKSLFFETWIYHSRNKLIDFFYCFKFFILILYRWIIIFVWLPRISGNTWFRQIRISTIW